MHNLMIIEELIHIFPLFFKIIHSKHLDDISQLRLTDLCLDGNPMVANFKDGAHFRRYLFRAPIVSSTNLHLKFYLRGLS